MDTSEVFAARKTPPKRRNPLQFTLRSLLILMALVAAFFGGRATMMPRLAAERAKLRAAEQRLAAEQAKAAGVRVIPFNVPFNARQTVPVSLDSLEAQDRAERANLFEHQRRYQRINLPQEEWRSGDPLSELHSR